jgi:hypothetical protein
MAFPKRYFPKTYFPERYFPPVTEVSVVAVNRRVSMGSAGGPWKLKGDPFKEHLKACYDQLDVKHREALQKANAQLTKARAEGRLRSLDDMRDLGGSFDPNELYIPEWDDLQLEDTGSPQAITACEMPVEASESAEERFEVTRRVVDQIIQKATESAKEAAEQARLDEEETEEILLLLAA